MRIGSPSWSSISLENAPRSRPGPPRAATATRAARRWCRRRGRIECSPARTYTSEVVPEVPRARRRACRRAARRRTSSPARRAAEVVPAEQVGHEDEVAARRDRQEFGEALDDPEDDGVEGGQVPDCGVRDATTRMGHVDCSCLFRRYEREREHAVGLRVGERSGLPVSTSSVTPTEPRPVPPPAGRRCRARARPLRPPPVGCARPGAVRESNLASMSTAAPGSRPERRHDTRIGANPRRERRRRARCAAAARGCGRDVAAVEDRDRDHSADGALRCREHAAGELRRWTRRACEVGRRRAFSPTAGRGWHDRSGVQGRGRRPGGAATARSEATTAAVTTATTKAAAHRREWTRGTAEHGGPSRRPATAVAESIGGRSGFCFGREATSVSATSTSTVT